MQQEKVLVIGTSGQVAFPVAKVLAHDNDVWGVARFKNRAARDSLESAGVRCHAVDLVRPDLSGLPDDFTYVLNFSVARTGLWQHDLDSNVGALGYLIEHCRKARAFLHCSTTAVYQPQPDHVFTENDPLGDNHRVWEETLPFLSTYSICKIAAEAMVRYGSDRWGLPAIISRLCVPYGDNGGWPSVHLDIMRAGIPIDVHPDRPNRFNPIHEDDIIATIPTLLGAADVPPPVVNWGGAVSSLEEWCSVLGELTGLEPRFTETGQTISGVPADISKLTALTGRRTWVNLREGLRRMVATRHPELLAEERSDPSQSA